MTQDRRSGTAAPARHARRRLALAALVLLVAGCTGTGTGTGTGGTGAEGRGGPGGTLPPGPSATLRSTLPPMPTTPATKPPPGNPPPTTGPPLSTRRKPEITEPTVQNPALMRLRGRIVDGVEPGCVIFRADDGTTWQLIELDFRTPPAGVVQVTGYEIPGLATTCQQGRPLRVVSILVP